MQGNFPSVGALLWFRGTYKCEQKLIYSQINAGQNKFNLVYY